jgi:hypothetical protein
MLKRFTPRPIAARAEQPIDPMPFVCLPTPAL